MEEKVNKIIQKVFKMKDSEINDSLKPRDVENWDSLLGMQLISEIEKEFNVRFEMEEIFDIYCIGDVKKILTKKLANNKSK